MLGFNGIKAFLDVLIDASFGLWALVLQLHKRSVADVQKVFPRICKKYFQESAKFFTCITGRFRLVLIHQSTKLLFKYLPPPAVLKVSKFRKQILKFSFAPKNERKYFCISALAYKKRSNQKSSVRESK